MVSRIVQQASSVPSGILGAYSQVLGSQAVADATALLDKLHWHHPETAWHCARVCLLTWQTSFAYSVLTGRALHARKALLGSILHDVGKAEVPASILSKVEPLHDDEWKALRAHPAIGWRLVMERPSLRAARTVVLNHHERWDGTGYPCRMPRHRIDKESRTVSVCDAFDAMTDPGRKFRVPFTIQEAKDALHSGAGSQFDPTVVRAFDLIPESLLTAVVDSHAFLM